MTTVKQSMSRMGMAICNVDGMNMHFLISSLRRQSLFCCYCFCAGNSCRCPALGICSDGLGREIFEFESHDVCTEVITLNIFFHSAVNLIIDDPYSLRMR